MWKIESFYCKLFKTYWTNTEKSSRSQQWCCQQGYQEQENMITIAQLSLKWKCHPKSDFYDTKWTCPRNFVHSYMPFTVHMVPCRTEFLSVRENVFLHVLSQSKMCKNNAPLILIGAPVLIKIQQFYAVAFFSPISILCSARYSQWHCCLLC